MPSEAKSILSVIRGNRHELRKRGLTGADIAALDSLAYLTALRRARSVRGAEVARSMGVSRQFVHRLVCRLEAAGAVIRVGGAIMLNVRGLLKWASDAVRGRLDAVRRCFVKKNARSVNARMTHRVKERETGETMVIPDRSEALKALAAGYVPVHLRVHRG